MAQALSSTGSTGRCVRGRHDASALPPAGAAPFVPPWPAAPFRAAPWTDRAAPFAPFAPAPEAAGTPCPGVPSQDVGRLVAAEAGHGGDVRRVGARRTSAAARVWAATSPA